MPISNALLKTLEITMDTIFKASGTDIRVHGIEHIPSHAAIFVVNHFTRMETFLMPYIIKKKIRRYPLSLAHHSFFGGAMGEFMERVGAVSTADPKRDATLISTLLNNTHPVVIFPEGQMVKDKKIIERGKFMVYNAGIRRPPHTGAARIGLTTQFIREKIKRFYQAGDRATIGRYASIYGFATSDLDRVMEQDTYIVPVNITYYPVRAKENAIQKLIERFSGEIQPRFEEELRVEGTMVMEGVDIDINFGRAIPVSSYLRENRRVARMIDDDIPYGAGEGVDALKALRPLQVKLMHEYMEGIYGLTTVNHDHIFSYLIKRAPTRGITESDFKNRAFLAIDILRKSGITNYHQTLNRKQFYLLTDDYHDKYANFIETMTSDGLISIENGVIRKNVERFTALYDFHTIRKDNIIEVLTNEIEPLTAFTRMLDRLSRTPACLIRRRIRNHFINLDQDLFEKDYRQYYIEGESKPKSVGAPFFKKRFLARRGVILVHGYMAAPEEMRPLADFLHAKGFTVYGARLRGHGTAPEDLATKRWEKWYDSVSRAYIIMKNSMRRFAIIGFSTGAGIALLQASNKPGRFAGIVSINAPLRLHNISSRLASAVVAWNRFLDRVRLSKGKMEFVTNNPENPHINYFRNPVSGVNELGKLMKQVGERLKYIMDPVLIVQGSEDPVVNPVSGLEIFEKIGTEDKQLVRIFARHHGILRGREAPEVEARVLDFLKRVFSQKGKG